MNYGEEPPVKSILMLPDDLVLNCLSRVPRFHYLTLSLVSKRFRSLLASTELSQTRTLLGHTETCLYVCLRPRTDSNQLHWFILCQRPNSSRRVLVPISSPNTLSMSGVAVVGPNIYAIGSGSKQNASSSVMVMDSRSHTWLEAPNMRVARVLPSVCALDGKICVTGGCDNLDSRNWMEIFDTETQTWEFLQIPSEEIFRGSEYMSVKYEGTLYVRSNDKDVTYKLHKGRWRETDLSINRIWSLCSPSSYCVIENVFYIYTKNRIIRWYDPKERVWTTLKGLEGMPRWPEIATRNVKVADHGGKIAMLWEEYDSRYERRTIWCAEIALEKRQNGEIWGTLEWFDLVFIPNGPSSSEFLMQALATTVGSVN